MNLKQLKKHIGYDKDTPRCETCVYMKTSQRSQGAGNPSYPICHCTRYGFTTLPTAVCDTYKDQYGTTLE